MKVKIIPVISAALAAFLLVSCAAPKTAQAPATSSQALRELSPEYRAELAQFDPLPAPATTGLFLRKGDRLAICGDSITEQKMYARIMETYLTVCTPELEVTTRQFGWSGEKADGFLGRMTNDVLRFDPTVATTCYGMNDHLYRPYEDAIGERYRKFMTAIVEAFKSNDVRVVVGSPGCVGKRPAWSKDTNATTLTLNQNLCRLRNIDVEIAREQEARFADVFWPMLTAYYVGQQRYGTNYAVPGKDGVHPDWSGHLIMAYAFLKALGLNGEIGTLTVDDKKGVAMASTGHEVISFHDGALEVRSSRYPFCATNQNLQSDATIRSGMSLVPFNDELNRFILRMTNPTAPSYGVTWGNESKTFTAAELKQGINLAAEFPVNPFWSAFNNVDKAVAAKQAYETKQIKQSFRSQDAKADMEAVAKQTEAERAPLAAAIKTAFVPVTHTLRIEPSKQ